VISFEMLASRCSLSDAICTLRQLANLPANRARKLPVNARSQPREYQDSRPLQPMTLDFLERGSTDDLKRLAELRCLAREALEMASSASVLWFATLRGHRAWIVTDRNRFVAEARRLDGQPWAHIGGKKNWTLRGGRKSWPIGIMEAENSRAIALVEGMPDFFAAFHWIWAEDRADVAPVAILGASMSILASRCRYSGESVSESFRTVTRRDSAASIQLASGKLNFGASARPSIASISRALLKATASRFRT
jgi:hypothetical protein